MPVSPAGAKPARWRRKRAEIKTQLSAIFASNTRDAWVTKLANKDCCLSPILDLDETATHPHFIARDLFATAQDGCPLVPRVAPCRPEFSGGIPVTSPKTTQEGLDQWMAT
ncbi:MAG: crotonobetainyl-CoA:carnitine CoA-transferase CaiB-like acyl-CoA transferase [Paracoccaceae bacterium]